MAAIGGGDGEAADASVTEEGIRWIPSRQPGPRRNYTAPPLENTKRQIGKGRLDCARGVAGALQTAAQTTHTAADKRAERQHR